MIETADFVDPLHGIPVFSLYGETRRPTDAMLGRRRRVLVDLQDLGTRIYTFVTTPRYVLEEAAATARQGGVGARPPKSHRSSGGRAPSARRLGELRPARGRPMRHGLTMAELARWFVREQSIDVELDVIPMDGSGIRTRHPASAGRRASCRG